ncbi:glycoside hydrolase family 75 protein [Undibacterium pigrum]|uniref:Chitosanase (Glycosyl hydrolase group 75) n=1 Tax=Undibacterium pigrum TaxID=401470 RepID=A0A318J0W7_9BURK|nr:glycoside hydrolase family 75 protein [Undibacterium pigrum]PXX41379.1 chitosanase (glycosyl hydrolase group 75) [Undibacterium pigrum]
MADIKTLLARIAYSDIYTLENDRTAYFFEAGMAIDADGAAHAYHPQTGMGLDYLGNAGVHGNWWALVTDNGMPSGKPLLQKASDPAPGFYISKTSLEDKDRALQDPRRYVDAEVIPFFVLPGKFKFGAKLGDLGIAINTGNGKICGCIHADNGPSGKIGEASIALANKLGVPSNPKKGGVAHGIVYVVFPGSASGWPASPDTLEQRAQAKFTAWGGLARLKNCLPDIAWQ